jgi:hypothetical protein
MHGSEEETGHMMANFNAMWEEGGRSAGGGFPEENVGSDGSMGDSGYSSNPRGGDSQELESERLLPVAGVGGGKHAAWVAKSKGVESFEEEAEEGLDSMGEGFAVGVDSSGEGFDEGVQPLGEGFGKGVQSLGEGFGEGVGKGVQSSEEVFGKTEDSSEEEASQGGQESSEVKDVEEGEVCDSDEDASQPESQRVLDSQVHCVAKYIPPFRPLPPPSSPSSLTTSLLSPSSLTTSLLIPYHLPPHPLPPPSSPLHPLPKRSSYIFLNSYTTLHCKMSRKTLSLRPVRCEGKGVARQASAADTGQPKPQILSLHPTHLPSIPFLLPFLLPHSPFIPSPILSLLCFLEGNPLSLPSLLSPPQLLLYFAISL